MPLSLSRSPLLLLSPSEKEQKPTPATALNPSEQVAAGMLPPPARRDAAVYRCGAPRSVLKRGVVEKQGTRRWVVGREEGGEEEDEEAAGTTLRCAAGKYKKKQKTEKSEIFDFPPSPVVVFFLVLLHKGAFHHFLNKKERCLWMFRCRYLDAFVQNERDLASFE